MLRTVMWPKPHPSYGVRYLSLLGLLSHEPSPGVRYLSCFVFCKKWYCNSPHPITFSTVVKTLTKDVGVGI